MAKDPHIVKPTRRVRGRREARVRVKNSVEVVSRARWVTAMRGEFVADEVCVIVVEVSVHTYAIASQTARQMRCGMRVRLGAAGGSRVVPHRSRCGGRSLMWGTYSWGTLSCAACQYVCRFR